MTSARSGWRRWGAEWPLALAFAAGVALRVVHLSDQILVGDEWHALVKSATAGPGEIFTTLGKSDHSIPVALYYELAAATVGLGDAVIRAPFLLFGVLGLLLLPLGARAFVKKPASDVFAWLLAVSPLLVYFSRFARPYGISACLCAVALFAFHRWWDDFRARWTALFAACASLSAWLLLTSVPFLAAPFAVGALRAWTGPREERRGRLESLLWLALVTASPAALLVLPPFVFDFGNISSKVGSDIPGVGLQLEALQILGGIEDLWFGVLFVFLGLLGFWRQARERTAWTALAASSVLLQWTAVVLCAPVNAMAFARYALPIVPVLLSWVACGALDLAGPLLRRLPAGARACFGPVLGAFFLAVGPLRGAWQSPDNWFASRLSIEMAGGTADRAERMRLTPAFYRELAARPPGSLTLIEAPWTIALALNPLPFYQSVHRQWTHVAFTNGVVPADGGAGAGSAELPWGELPLGSAYRSRNVLWLADLLESDVERGDYLVLHKDLASEFLGSAPRVSAALTPVDVGPLVERFRSRFGEPVHEDARLAVFALRR